MVATSILVTGATGYIGSQVLLELLDRFGGDGFRLRALVRNSSDCSVFSGFPVEIIRGDLLDIFSLGEAFSGVDTVFHCAGLISYSRRFRRRLYDVNVVGTRNVVNTCIAHRVRRLVMTSSIAALGVADDGSAATETTPFRESQRRNGYMDAKHLAELEAFRGAAEGLDVVLLNPGVVIGVDHRNKASVSTSNKVLRMIYHGVPAVCPSGGTGFVDVRDVAAAHVEAWLKGRSCLRYIIVGHNLAFAELFDALRSLPGNSVKALHTLPVPALYIAGMVGEVWSLLMNRPSFIAIESGRMASERLVYSNSRSLREFGMIYRGLSETLNSIVAV